MNIRLTFHNQDFTATLFDNASALDFLSMLPLKLNISDMSDGARFAFLPRRLNDTARGPFPNFGAGDICYHMPSGKLMFFCIEYKSLDSLVRLGRLDNGVQPLYARGKSSLRIERY